MLEVPWVAKLAGHGAVLELAEPARATDVQPVSGVPLLGKAPVPVGLARVTAAGGRAAPASRGGAGERGGPAAAVRVVAVVAGEVPADAGAARVVLIPPARQGGDLKAGVDQVCGRRRVDDLKQGRLGRRRVVGVAAVTGDDAVHAKCE